MRLLVSCIPYDRGKSGISVYVRETVAALAAQGHELTLLCEPGEEGFSGHETADEGRERSSRLASDVSRQKSCRVVLAPGWTRRPALSMLWHLLVLPFWIRRRRNSFDAFFICSANRRVCAWYPLPTVATVHDLANFHVPGKYSRLRMFYLAHILPRFAKKAHHLVAVSGSTKADMVKFWRCREDKVTVLYNGLGDSGDPGKSGDSGKTGNSGKSGNSGGPGGPGRPNAILYISRIEHPGKNHLRLIEAYSRLPPETAAAHPLVLAGADWKDSAPVHEAAAKSPNAAHIRFTGFVDDLEALWRDAGFYVFPSLFEGFGLSLAEAMARGIPCACSNNGSLGEIGADAAIKFDPQDVGSIAAALEELLGESEESRAARIERGRARAACFSWEKHARGIVSLLGNASVFGVGIDCTTNAEAAAALRKPPPDGRFFAFVNAHCLNVAYRDEEYREILNGRCERVWPDGVGVLMAGRKLGFAVPENVNGTDLLPLVMEEGGLSFWFLGAAPGVAEEAMRRCRERFPRSRFLGASDGFAKDWNPVIAEISAARPDVLLVGMGVPLQEKWIAAHIGDLKGVGAVVAIGALLDFLSGRVRRAPVWMRRAKLEWVWRLAIEPRRMFRRYVIGNFLFLRRVGQEAKK